MNMYHFVAFTASEMARNYACPNKDDDPMVKLPSMIADSRLADQ